MENCTNHNELKVEYICQKYNRSFCKECLECRDPDTFCKHRNACMIWFMTRKELD
jgi:hypothetical protein